MQLELEMLDPSLKKNQMVFNYSISPETLNYK